MKAPVTAVASLGLALWGACAATANAAELKVWTARSLANVLRDVGPQFERSTGHKLVISEGLRDQFLKRIEAREQFDLLILPPPVVDGLIWQGKIIRDTRVTLAHSAIGVAVRAGAPRPNISSVEAFKQALLDAKSIAYPSVSSGEDIVNLFKRLGIARAVEPKVTRLGLGRVSDLVARGEVEFGMVVKAQAVMTPGVEFAGPLPSEIRSYLLFTAGVSALSKAPDAARDLIAFLQGPIAASVIVAKGMDAD